MRSSGLPRDVPWLQLVPTPGGSHPAPAARAPYRPPVRVDGPTRPEWSHPLPSSMVDLPDPDEPATHLEAAIDLLRRAAQSESVSERGDALLVAIEHAARSLGELFDAEAAKKHLRGVSERL